MRNKLIGLFLFFTLLAGTILPVNAVDKKVNIYVFYSRTCIHCAAEEVYLDKLKAEDTLSVYRYEITDSKENQELMKKVGDLLNISTVPFVIIGNRTITGFTEGVSDVSIDSAAITYVEHNVRDLVGEMLGIVTPSTGGETTNTSSTVTPVFSNSRCQSSFTSFNDHRFGYIGWIQSLCYVGTIVTVDQYVAEFEKPFPDVDTRRNILINFGIHVFSVYAVMAQYHSYLR